MKFIYVSDVHGDNAKYRKLISICQKEGISNIVIGGDLYSRPRDKGENQLSYVRNELNDFFKKCEKNGIRVMFVLGNLDLEQYDGALQEVISRYPFIHYIDKECFEIEDVCFIGMSDTIDGPGNKKNRVTVEDETPMEKQFFDTCYIEKGTREITSEEWAEYRKTNVRKMKDVLAELPKNTSDKKTIYVFHQPPYGVGLDLCADYHAAGSKNVLEFIKKSDAYMSLHGHMHDSYEMSGVWKTRVSGTVVVQTGQYVGTQKKMSFVVIDTETDYCEAFVAALD